MPTVGVKKEQLFAKIGQTFSDDEFDHLCFQFGIELDEIVNEDGKETQYKIDIPANRYDLLCVEGLSRALAIFLKKCPPPKYELVNPPKKIQTFVSQSTSLVRPFVVTAVLRDVTLSQESYDSLIELQEKLHHNICRKRAFVAIGIHDLDKISPPFYYTAEPPKQIKFVPLNQPKEYVADDLMEFYKNDMHLKGYLHITRDEPLYPVIRDSNGDVLSMPPIINGDLSKLSTATKNLYIECTATDLTKAKIVLDTLVTMISEHCKVKFGIEATEVINEATKEVTIFPTLKYRTETIDVGQVNSTVGIELSAEAMAESLSRMGLESSADDPKGQTISVCIPPTRHDVLHACDIIEDVAISYGYDNIMSKVPPTATIAAQFPLNKLTDGLREGIAMSGFTEALTFSLGSVEDYCEKLRHSQDVREKTLARIANPKTLEFQAARQSLIPGLLKTVHANKKMPLPLRLFEVSDVVLLDEKTEVGARNERRLAAVNYNKTTGFEVIHGLLDRVMTLLEVPFEDEKNGYVLKSFDDPTYFPGRCAQILYKGNVIGLFGVLHPEVIEQFELNLPCAALEINIEPFL